MSEPKHVVGLSGGGDSTAMALWLAENEPRDYEYICNATGNELANVLQGNAAANTLNGGVGNDTYLIGRGGGADLIQDNDTKAGNVDTVRFLADIAADQLWFRKVGNHLEVSVIGTADKATIDSWYTNAKFRVEQFQTSAGQTLAMGGVENLVSAMAGLTARGSPVFLNSLRTMFMLRGASIASRTVLGPMRTTRTVMLSPI